MFSSINTNTIASSNKNNMFDEDNTTNNIVIIGAGMAGSRLAILLAKAFNKQSTNSKNDKSPQCHSPKITLISKEPQVGYNRIMLSPVLAGEKKFEDTYLFSKQDYQQFGINIIAGVGVEQINSQEQTLLLDNGTSLDYDKLVLATGSNAKVIPFPGHQAKQVHVFRDVEDVNKLVGYAKQGKKGLIIGGGVLGLEAACALSAQGADMTVIHVDDYVLNRQLDKPAALLLQDELARRNVGLELSAMSEAIEVDDKGNVTGLLLKNDRLIKADFIVMAVGIAPNIQLAADSGIEVNRGIVVDAFMHTSVDQIYAIGECVEINEELFGMVSSVNQHVDSLVSVFTSEFNKENWQPFVSVPLTFKLKVSGVAVFSAGQLHFDETENQSIETMVFNQHLGGIDKSFTDGSEHYQCLYINDNKLVGAVLYGETNESAFYSKLINEQIDISSIKDNLLYGEVFCDLDTCESSKEDINNIDINSSDTNSDTAIVADASNSPELDSSTKYVTNIEDLNNSKNTLSSCNETNLVKTDNMLNDPEEMLTS